MGWSFCFAHTEKRHIIEDRIKGFTGEKYKVEFLDHSVVGNHLWKVGKSTNLETGFSDLWIGLDLLSKSKYDRCWGYKDMEESMGPYFYDCPLKFLKMVPPPDSKSADGWREKVIAFHAKKKADAARKIEAGKTYALVNRTIPQVTISSVKPLRGYYNGITYRLTKKIIGKEITKPE